MKRITNPDNNMWRSADPPQRTTEYPTRRGVVPQMLPPYGDDPRDQMWIRQGMSDYVKNKKMR